MSKEDGCLASSIVRGSERWTRLNFQLLDRISRAYTVHIAYLC